MRLRLWGFGFRSSGPEFGIEEQILRRDVKRFQGELVFEAHRPLYHSTLGPRVTKKTKRNREFRVEIGVPGWGKGQFELRV